MHQHKKTYITPEQILSMTFGNKLPKLPKIIYIFFYTAVFKKIEDVFDFEKVAFTRGELYVEKNKKFGIIIKLGAGESGALMLAEELSALGVKRIVTIGAAGSLSEKLKIGDTAIIEKAISQSEIGKVYEYTKDEVYTSKEQSQQIEAKLKENKINAQVVKTLSVPTIYRETSDLIAKAKVHGVSVIEMEAFSLALVCALRRVHFSAIVCISDTLREDGWAFEDSFKTVFIKLEEVFRSLQTKE